MKLSKVKFLDASNAKELSKDEQKLILGGYSGSSCCFYVEKDDSGNTHYQCASSPSEAEGNAGGNYGTWACGTDEAKTLCNC